MEYNESTSKTVLYGALTVLIAMLVVTSFYVMGYFSRTNAGNTVVFSGEGKVSAKPDIAVIDFSIVTSGKTSKEAQDKNSTKSKGVTDFLKKQGVDDKDIKNTGYNIYPSYYYPQPIPLSFPEGKAMPIVEEITSPRITGYQITQSFQVTIRDFDKASAIVDGLVKVGVNQVNSLQFQIEEPEKLKAEARSKAIADAKNKADELKGQVGINLGRIVNFQENTSGYPGPYYEKSMISISGLGGGEGPSLPTGENEVTVSVSITYQIK